MFGYGFYVDPSRCIGCRSCVAACGECDSHRGISMIHVDYLDRKNTIATAPMVCMHCDEPTCALVCPADAIKKGEDGVVQQRIEASLHRLLQLRPGLSVRSSEGAYRDLELMMKCDMCYDRTSVGLRPMCATVCPSQALSYLRWRRSHGSGAPARERFSFRQ